MNVLRSNGCARCAGVLRWHAIVIAITQATMTGRLISPMPISQEEGQVDYSSLKALFLVNARSGPNRKRDMTAVIRHSCDWDGYEIAPCERREDLDDVVARAQRERFDVVFAVGGDGTVHEVGKRLIGTELALAIMPTGSGNGLARHIGFPVDPRKTVEACRDARVIAIDTAEVNGIPFIGTMGVGYDALIAERFASSHVRGFRSYMKIGMRAFFDYKAGHYEVVIDGRSFQRRAFVIAICNSSQYGNNATMAPRASMTDGILDVVMIEDVSMLGAFALLPRLLEGTIDHSSKVTIARGKEIEIRRASEGGAHLDGEPLVLPRELQVRVRPQSLNVLVPASTKSI